MNKKIIRFKMAAKIIFSHPKNMYMLISLKTAQVISIFSPKDA